MAWSVRNCRMAVALGLAAVAAVSGAASAQAQASQPGAEAKYRDLAGQEQARAGEPDYDYALGIAALDAGHYGEAVIALQRVLAVQPDNAPARAELARAYALAGDIDTARAQFATVVDDPSLPDPVRQRFTGFVRQFDKQIAGGGSDVSGFADARVGHDSNINSATDLSTITIPLFAFLGPGTLGAGARAQKDEFYELSAGLSGVSAVGRQDRIFGSALGSWHDNWDSRAFDQASLTGTAGYAHTFANRTSSRSRRKCRNSGSARPPIARPTGPARSTPTPTPTPSGFTGTRDPIVYYTFTSGSLASAFGGSADFVDGAPVKFTSAFGTVDLNDAQAVEAGDVGDLAWARWTGGTVLTRSILGNADTAIGANGGYHVMVGNASTSLPASGKVDYSLLATTSATDNRGSAPGTVTGDLSILFGSTSRVGYDMQMDVGGWSWAVATTGGAADPSQSEITLTSSSAGPKFGGTFNNGFGNVTAGGGACAVSCIVSVSGALFGDNGAYVGVAMDVLDSSGSGVVTADGLAIFGNAPATTTALASTPVPAADVNMASVQASQWNRWSGSATATAVATLDMPTLQREAAAGLAGIDLAGIEQRLGKFITFNRP